MPIENPTIFAITMLQDYKGDLARRDFPDNDEGDHQQRVNESKRASVDAAIAGLRNAHVQQVSVPDGRAAFEREDRYIVIKRSDMDRIPNQKVVHSFLGALGELSAHSVRIPQRKFLVIESDWPEYDPAWKLIQDRVQGRPILDAAQAAPAADADPCPKCIPGTVCRTPKCGRLKRGRQP